MKTFENKLYSKGYQNVAGLDEVGRGCWAGPLVVAICVLPINYENLKIKDSKKLSHKQRESLYLEILEHAIIVDYIVFDPEFVDEHNPKQTSIIGMQMLIDKHKNQLDFCLIDAEKINSCIPCESIIQGDNKSQSIAAASIVAKVVRDQYMINLSKQFKGYGFELHKGYGTKKHQDALKKLGPIQGVHRFSYKPIKKLLKD